MIRGLDHPSYERLREPSLFRLEKSLRGVLINACKYLKVGCVLVRFQGLKLVQPSKDQTRALPVYNKQALL